ncbi:hypothetical protein ACF09C_02495 [Streptomyces sp. NPDC014870]|uniref:hypothetical protein n=1 Tax=Streptomyces sp. NPDC014870 TaxID=3364925 RepID=UPI0036F4C294
MPLGPERELAPLPPGRVRLVAHLVEAFLQLGDPLAVALQLGADELGVGHLLRGLFADLLRLGPEPLRRRVQFGDGHLRGLGHGLDARLGALGLGSSTARQGAQGHVSVPTDTFYMTGGSRFAAGAR